MGQLNTSLLVFITILSEPSSARSIAPCQGKHFCESPPDYPAILIRNLLKNNNFPQGFFKNQDISEEEKGDFETINKNIIVDSINQHLGDNHGSELKSVKDYDGSEIKTEFPGYTDKHSHLSDISTV